MDKITIVKDIGTPVEENQEIRSEGYILMYADKAKMKVTGSLDLHMLTPLISEIVKFFAEKMKSS
ncbi:MAG: hypothetical protein JRD89_03785 [Deltaproteobacteria bacterium]|nr:hypothetical protein [Deltaproteobacteria bacterium]